MTLPEHPALPGGRDVVGGPLELGGKVRNARTAVLFLLLLQVVMAVALALHLTRPPTPGATVLFVTAVAGYAAALTLVCFTAVTPMAGRRRRLLAVWALVAASAVLWAPSFAWCRPDEEPWAWLAGFGGALLTLITPRWSAAALAVGAIGACVLGSLVFDEPVVRQLTILALCTGVVLLMVLVVVRLLRLLTAAEASKALEAQLAVTQERLRMSRELHDTLGHRLGIIALEAELATGLLDSDTDAGRARVHTEQIQRLAATTLREARRAVVGETVSDLSTQAASARLVLESAGIDVIIALHESLQLLSPAQSQLCAAVVREGVTNVLRHADATAVQITLVTDATGMVLTLHNDQRAPAPTCPTSPAGAGGTGLVGLAARCNEAGALLTYGPDRAGGFHLMLHLPRGENRGPGVAGATRVGSGPR